MPSITITTTTVQAQRLSKAIGRALGLTDEAGTPRGATLAEAKGYLIDHLRTLVRTDETQTAIEAAARDPFDPT